MFFGQSWNVSAVKFCTESLSRFDYVPAANQLENLCYTLQMRPIRSSEIGSYLYCRRAWWYRKIGTPSEIKAELAAGTNSTAGMEGKSLLRLSPGPLGWLLLLAAILTLVAYCAAQL
jgi:hypothetical protein